MADGNKCQRCGRNERAAGYQICEMCLKRQRQTARALSFRRSHRRMLEDARGTGDIERVDKLIQIVLDDMDRLRKERNAAVSDMRKLMRDPSRVCEFCRHGGNGACGVDDDTCEQIAEWKGIADGTGEKVSDMVRADLPGYRERERLKRDQMMRNGLCPRCGGKREDPKRVLCAACREYGKMQKIRHPPTKAENARDAQRHREKRKANREAGLCACGREPTPGYRTCERCRERSRANARSWYRQNIADAKPQDDS